METELKLAISAADVEAIEKLPLLQTYGNGEVEERRLVSTYYDTPAWILKQEKTSLRIRDKGDGWVRTVKTAGNNEGGLHRREEFEVALSEPELDLEALQNLGLDVLNRAIASQQLQPVFITDFVRRQWLLHAPNGGPTVEFALDQGAVRRCDSGFNEAGESSSDFELISEIELELRDSAEDADPEFLFRLADEIKQAGIQSQPSTLSKAARGYALLQKA